MAQIAQRQRQQAYPNAPRRPGIFSQFRWTELSLLIIPFILFLLSMMQLLFANQPTGHAVKIDPLQLRQGLTPILGLITALFIVHIILNAFFRKADQILLPLVGLLSGIGVLISTSLGTETGNANLGTKQLLWVLIGLFVFLITMFVLRNIQLLARFKYTAALFGVALFAATVANSLRSPLNAPTHDQLKIGSFSFQPSEILKICIVIFFAAYLSENRDILIEGGYRWGPFRLPPLRQLGPILMMLFIGLLLFLFVRELGLALLIYGLFLTMMYLGTGKMSYTFTALVVAVFLGFIGYLLLGYVRQRFAVVGIDVVNWTAASDAQYFNGGGQVVQGLIALASGGLIGAGLGLGAAGYYVPVSTTDMVFTSLGEEIGLVGLFAIIGIYLLIVYRGFRIAEQATDPFKQLLAAGLTSIFAIQSFIICAGNLKLIPLTGIPLPFLSYGGSSMIANFIIVGILLKISNDTRVELEGK
jgi:cell division protein FtsW (lipid II flippase)